MWTNISQKLKTILEANNKIQEVFEFENEQSKGSPFATITPSDNENEYATTTENERVYAFNIRLFREWGIDDDAHEECERVLKNLTESVLDDLDKNDRLSGLVIDTGYTFLMMDAAPSVWFYQEREKIFRVAEIIITIKMHVDINIIS